jgi:hypothetical protein
VNGKSLEQSSSLSTASCKKTIMTPSCFFSPDGSRPCCFRCGRKSHLANRCYAATDVNGELFNASFFSPEPRVSSSRPSSGLKSTSACFRCGRENHYLGECYAKTTVTGHRLKSSSMSSSSAGKVVKTRSYHNNSHYSSFRSSDSKGACHSNQTGKSYYSSQSGRRSAYQGYQTEKNYYSSKNGSRGAYQGYQTEKNYYSSKSGSRGAYQGYQTKKSYYSSKRSFWY